MAVPKCSECKCRKMSTVGWDYQCRHPEVGVRGIRGVKTSPKWCPLRKAGDSHAD